jgi:pimeloyl-ACP methyl ester carboxylesterase
MKDAENQGLTPGSFQLPFEDVTFASRDGVPLSGWWVAAPEAKGTVVLVHGLNRSRIEMVKKTPFLHKLGWNVLLFDLRRHGASGGTVRSMGLRERLDVIAAADLARSRAPLPVVAWGISFGAAAATLAAAEDPQIAGLVCDSSFRSLRDTARRHLALFRSFRWWLRLVPAWPTSDIAVFWMGRRGGFDPDELDILKAAAKLSDRPALFVASSGDERMPPDIARDLAAAAGARARTLLVTSEGHGHAYRDGTAAYEAAVTALLESVSSSSKGELR